MILLRAERVGERDLSRYAWSRLRRFRNVPDVQEMIMRLHGLGRDQKDNAKKQATQIRDCLIQAQEYFDAAAAVTLATKPVLFYYSMMSLALAEVLLKQDGKSSLDAARDRHHKHHGLLFTKSDLPRGNHPLGVKAASLVAKPLIDRNGERFGTFELWHRSCRETPLAGTITDYPSSGVISRTHFGLIFDPLDIRPPLLPPSGLSLLECLRRLPGTLDVVPGLGVEPYIVRGTVSQERHETNGRETTAIIIHPGLPDLIEAFFSYARNRAADGAERLSFHEMRTGGSIRWTDMPGTERTRMELPNGTMWTDQLAVFWPTKQPLNEFGFIYVALFIVGNYARYYPDLWMEDVERSSPLALAMEEFLAMAAVRMPLLALSEMSRTYFVPTR